MLLVCRFAVPPAGTERFAARARTALELLTAQPGCLGGRLGRAAEDPDRWVLVVEFESVVAYRRALSPFPVREHVVPFLAEALTDETSVLEVLASASGGVVEQRVSLLAADSGSVRVGEAAGPEVPPR
ncbi:antibiotic biosynthesis monooxygenase family protein [Streptoalloteichus hindustanus]|uniref:Antibiotic biosynthesis monooxygenase n=1 Tax=Streptoalloteichus hindustanus TaxID=2017 RepID=A0A1M5BI38_STRHI|nr:antibiotic biosynthesis monooxygenase family protein [Streptoalloteichus hindustanus]SHF41882.1 Antibiotic biosynthesis monooxygenase [Streptoalloteichus hindustanus]